MTVRSHLAPADRLNKLVLQQESLPGSISLNSFSDTLNVLYLLH